MEQKNRRKNRGKEARTDILRDAEADGTKNSSGGVLGFHQLFPNEQPEDFLTHRASPKKDIEECRLEKIKLLDRVHDLETQNERKDRIFAIVAHELRNILAPIMSSIDMAKLHKGDDLQLDEICNTIERQTMHMTRILNDLLDVSRIAMKKVELSKEWISIGEIMQRTVEAAHTHMQERKHTLTLTLPPKPIYLFLDPNRMEQVFSNLLHNAAKYTDIGGKIEIRVSKEGDAVLVCIKDNGVGIDASHLLKIFEFFVQTDKKCSKNGLGIGLGIAKFFTELHGGTVTARSEGPGKGSEFIVRLPIPPKGAHSMEKIAVSFSETNG